MPISSLLENQIVFDPEDIAVLSAAFEDTLRSLRLVKRSDPAVSIVAERLIEIAKSGERDPVRLRERTLKTLHVTPTARDLASNKTAAALP
jgi:hypothetical protein